MSLGILEILQNVTHFLHFDVWTETPLDGLKAMKFVIRAINYIASHDTLVYITGHRRRIMCISIKGSIVHKM